MLRAQADSRTTATGVDESFAKIAPQAREVRNSPAFCADENSPLLVHSPGRLMRKGCFLEIAVIAI
jgi:hypothetical protein